MEALNVFVNFEANTRGFTQGVGKVTTELRLAQIQAEKAQAALDNMQQAIVRGAQKLNEAGGDLQTLVEQLNAAREAWLSGVEQLAVANELAAGATEAERDAARELVQTYEEELAVLAEEFNAFETAIAIKTEATAVEEELLKATIARNKAVEDAAREEVIAAQTTEETAGALRTMGREFNLSATEITQWIQILRTGNVTQGLFTQGIHRLSLVIGRFLPVSFGMAAAITGIGFAAYSIIKNIVDLNNEMRDIDVRMEFVTGRAIDLTRVWDNLVDTFDASQSEMSRVAASFATLAASVGLPGSEIEDFAITATTSVAGLADALRLEAKEVSGAVEGLLQGNVSAFNRLTGQFLEEDAVIRRALQDTGKVYAEYLTSAEIARAGEAILAETNADLVAEEQRQIRAELRKTISAYLEMLAVQIATNTEDVGRQVQIAEFLESQGIDLASRSVEDLMAGLKELESQVRQADYIDGWANRWENSAGRSEESIDEVKNTALQMGSQLIANFERLAPLVERALAGDPQAARELLLQIEAIRDNVGDLPKTFEDFLKYAEATGNLTEELRTETELLNDAYAALASGDMEGFYSILSQVNDMLQDTAASTENLTNAGFSLVNSVISLAEAYVRHNQQPTAQTALDIAQAFSAVVAQSENADEALAAVNQELDLMQALGLITAESADAVRVGLNAIGRVATLAQSPIIGMGAAFEIFSAASREATKVALTNLLILAVQLNRIASLFPVSVPIIDTYSIFQAIAALDSFDAALNTVIGTWTDVGSAAGSATSQIATFEQTMNQAISATMAFADAQFALEDAQQNLIDLQERQLELPSLIAEANQDWLNSLDALADAEARLREEQEKSLEVTNAEKVAIEELEDKLFLAQRAYAQGTISAAKLASIQDELNQAIEDSTAPTREEDRARRDLERAQRDVERAEERMNALKDEQARISREIERAELAILSAALRQVTAYQDMIAAQEALSQLTAAEVEKWREIARLAGVSGDLISNLTSGITTGATSSANQIGDTVEAIQQLYTVVSGDTLSKIAARFGLDLQTLLAQNPQITNPDLIFPGQEVNVTQAAQDLHEAGRNVAQSFTDGFSSAANEWVATAEEASTAVKETVNQQFEIQSPSRFMERVAHFLVDGFLIGIRARAADMDVPIELPASIDEQFSLPIVIPAELAEQFELPKTESIKLFVEWELPSIESIEVIVGDIPTIAPMVMEIVVVGDVPTVEPIEILIGDIPTVEPEPINVLVDIPTVEPEPIDILIGDIPTVDPVKVFIEDLPAIDPIDVFVDVPAIDPIEMFFDVPDLPPVPSEIDLTSLQDVRDLIADGKWEIAPILPEPPEYMLDPRPPFPQPRPDINEHAGLVRLVRAMQECCRRMESPRFPRFPIDIPDWFPGSIDPDFYIRRRQEDIEDLKPHQDVWHITVNSVFPVDEEMANKTVEAIETVMQQRTQAVS